MKVVSSMSRPAWFANVKTGNACIVLFEPQINASNKNKHREMGGRKQEKTKDKDTPLKSSTK